MGLLCLPDGVVERQVLLSELRLRAERQVDLQVAVLHPLRREVALRLGQHGRQRHALFHGLPMVTADDMTERISLSVAAETYSHSSQMKRQSSYLQFVEAPTMSLSLFRTEKPTEKHSDLRICVCEEQCEQQRLKTARFRLYQSE